jgi:tetrahydromethanopterin S-methyltransferase subunit D
METKRRKGVLQRVSLGSGVLGFILAGVCGVLLYARMGETTGHDPINASLMASIFFFLCVGGILTFIGMCNLPSFKIDLTKEE